MKVHEATEQAYKNGYDKGRKEAANEIFAEIEKCRVVGSYGVCGFLIHDILVLKKKFTGEHE